MLKSDNNFALKLLSIEVILKETDKKSNDFIHQIPEDESIGNISKNTVNSLNRIFRNDITVCNSAYNTNAIIHNINIDIWPS